MTNMGRNTWIGLGVGVTVGISLVLFLVIYKKTKSRLCQSLSLPSNSDALLLSKDGASVATVSHGFEVQAGSSLEALAVRPKRGLLVEQQVELQNKLDEVLQCVDCLRAEVGSLRGDLQDVAVQIVQDVKKDLEESHKVARRRRLPPRERADSVSSCSVYFTASCRYDGESEGGYSTANGESDCYGEAEQDMKIDAEDKEDEEDVEDKSQVTECTLRRDSSDAETEEEEFSDAESPGDTSSGVPSHGALLHCSNQGLDVDAPSPEAQKPVKDVKRALVSRGKQ